MFIDDQEYVEEKVDTNKVLFKEFSLDKIMETFGGSGPYQKRIVLNSVLSLFAAAFVSFSLSFFASEPIFTCE